MANEEFISEAEAKLYWDAFFAAVRVLITAQSKLQELEEDTDDLAERAGYRADRLRLGDALAELNQRHVAFIAGTSAIRPPSKKIVDGVVKLVAEVANLEAERDNADAIVKIATKAAEQIAKLEEG
jgi:hypothetical protein